MNHLSICNPPMSADDAIAHIESGMRIFITGNCSFPQQLMDALVRRAPALQDVEIVQVLTIGNADYVQPAMQGHLRVNTLFISENVRAAVNEGRADFTPCLLSEIPLLFRRSTLPLDAAFVHVSPPDEHGFCSYGVEIGVTKAAAESARMVIAEVNPRMPRTLGDSFIHMSKINYCVDVDYPLPEFRSSETGPLYQKIGKYIADMIEDGDCLQLGIGAIPNGVLPYLSSKRDLGIHSEMFSDGIIELVEQGIINGERKTLHPGKIIAGFCLGTQRLYDFVHDNPLMEFRPTEYVNNPFLIAQNDHMVAINSAIEVDLTGQVCADSIGPRLYSGVGGQLDFIRGAACSNGGKPIIALTSTATLRDGRQVSKIVTMLKPGAGVTTTRNDVHYVVTEYGVASLYGKTIRQRARALIDVAHPNFREELERCAEDLKYL
ncbi:MAG: 4-hydroxybutyrate CoA-transferase [Chloroflexi bacterium]|nr:4-hydroxybutyrate CoA-transferase [Chloroflexota bacterium]